MSKGVNIPLTISGLKDAKKELAELEQQLKDVDKRTTESKDLKTKYDQLAKSIDGVNQELKETEQLAGGGLKKFTNEVKNTEKATLTVKQQLRLLTDQMAEIGDVGSPEFQKLANEAGVLRDKMNNARAAIDSMAEDFPRLKLGTQALQAVGGAAQVAVGGVQALGVENENLMAAMQRLMAIQSALNGLQTISQQLGDESALGLAIRKVRMEGLGKSIKSLGASFKAFGASLLTNPIFLIVAVIAAIVTAVVTLKDKVKILGVIFDAVGKAIGWVVQQLKDFLDWIGLTSFAADEAAEAEKKRAEESLKNIEAKSNSEQSAFDRKIALLNAEGKSTKDLEIAKQKAIIETNKARIKELQIIFEQERILGNLTAERAKELVSQKRELVESAKNAANQIKIIEINAAKEVKDKEKESLEKRKEAYKNYTKAREDATRMIQDLEIELMKEGTERELAEVNLKYDRLIEDTKKNEDMLRSEKEKVIKYYESLRALEEGKILAAEKQTEKQKQEATAKFLMDANEAQMQLIEGFQEEAYQLLLTDQEREEEALRTKYEEKLNLARQYGQDTLSIEEAYAKEKADMEEKFRKEKLEKEQALEDAKVNLVSSGLSTVSQLTELFAGKSEKAAKRAFAIQKAVSISQAIIDTYKGANAIFASAAANPSSVLFPAQPFITAGIAIASGLANVAKIASAQFQGGSSGGGGGTSAPSLGGGGATSSSSSTPSFELFGQANEGNNVSAPQSQETTQMTVKAVVVESDITSTQNKINKIQKSAEL